jgi:hypothetical protein
VTFPFISENVDFVVLSIAQYIAYNGEVVMQKFLNDYLIDEKN